LPLSKNVITVCDNLEASISFRSIVIFVVPVDSDFKSVQDEYKLSYPQSKCASNVAILYGADGISI